MESLRISERSLKSRLKNLTRELTAAKQVYRMSPVVTLRRSSERRQSDPGERHFRARKFSNSKLTNSGNKMSKPRRKLSTESMTFSSKARTPSPSGGRFDPTAYIESKRRQQLERDTRLT